MKQTFKWIYMMVGVVATILGFIGAFLPLLPTTPFLLLASYCFIRSSKRAHDWLMNHRILGRYLRNYIENKAIEVEHRRKALIFLWGTLLVSIILTDMVHLKIFLVFVGCGVTIHLMMLKVME